jgi:hypothetical protein
MVNKFTNDQLLVRDEAYKVYVEKCKVEGKIPKTRHQFNKQWEKTHFGYAV